jgi:GlpG protein
MNEFGNTIKIGELADKKVADQIVSELLKRNIHVKVHLDTVTGLYLITSEDKATAPKAFDYYRVKVGLAPPPREMPEEYKKMKSTPLGMVTLAFLAISLSVYVSKMFVGDSVYKLFFMTNDFGQNAFLPEVMRGEIWRLFTPVFLHFNFLHILFNGMWMKDLGSLIESFKGKGHYILLLVCSGLLSNFAQYFVSQNPFGGLSGIVYALLGFIWMNKRFDENTTYALPKNDILMLIGWFFLCFTGVFGSIANTAHGVGLAVGMLFGIFSGAKASGKFPTTDIIKFSSMAVFFGVGTISFEFFILPMITGN